MTWEKGQSGNPGGRSVTKPLTDALRMHLLRNESEEIDPKEARTNAQTIAANLIIAAKNGETAAIRECFDRIEGKSVQSNNITGGVTLAELVMGSMKPGSEGALPQIDVPNK